ncbi:MAG: mechanosensitive ion channel [Candidatus Cloacimonetes bacterium]|nr:mechanosensitive ion channel [Candidatus Cloacimonadota bacterium]
MKKIEDENSQRSIKTVIKIVFEVLVFVFGLNIIGFDLKFFGDIWKARLFSIQGEGVSLGNLFIGLVILFIGFKLAKYFSKKIKMFFEKKFKFDISQGAIVESVSKYVLLIVLVLFVLSIVGIPLTIFTIIGGSLAIGIGFGSKNLMNNFISGVFLMTERQLKVGDIIEVEGNTGTIEHIGARSTIIKTFSNLRMLLPNSKLLENSVINWTLTDKVVRRELTVGVTYGSPVEKVKDLLYQVVDRNEDVVDNPKPVVLFSEFADSALVFKVLIWINLQKAINVRILLSDLRFAIDKIFRENKIVIAFPQIDAHLDTSKPLNIQLTNKDKVSE